MISMIKITSSSYPSSSTYISTHPSTSQPSSYSLLSPAAPLPSTSDAPSLAPPKPARLGNPRGTETSPVITKTAPGDPASISIMPLNPEPTEFVPRVPVSESNDPLVAPLLTKLSPDPPVFVPSVSAKLRPDPPVFVPLKRRDESWKVPENWAEAAEFVPNKASVRL